MSQIIRVIYQLEIQLFFYMSWLLVITLFAHFGIEGRGKVGTMCVTYLSSASHREINYSAHAILSYSQNSYKRFLL